MEIEPTLLTCGLIHLFAGFYGAYQRHKQKLKLLHAKKQRTT